MVAKAKRKGCRRLCLGLLAATRKSAQACLGVWKWIQMTDPMTVAKDRDGARNGDSKTGFFITCLGRQKKLRQA